MKALPLLRNVVLGAALVLSASVELALSAGNPGDNSGGDDRGAAGAPARGGQWRNNPAWRACRQQANDKQLARGPERRQFMQDCLKAAAAAAPKNPG